MNLLRALQDLDARATAIRPETPCPRQGEINNILTGIRGQIEALETIEDFPMIERREIVGDAYEMIVAGEKRIKDLEDNPESAGRHEEILEAVADTLRSGDLESNQ